MAQAPEGGARDAAARLGQDTADLVRAEVQRRRDDLMATVWRSSTALALFGGAAGCGLLAVGMGEVTLLRGLEKVMPRGRAALVLTTFHAASAAGLAVAGRRALQQARASAQSTLDKASDDVRTARAEVARPPTDEPM
jgi:hypothetical protein